jgi:hypothetical protein
MNSYTKFIFLFLFASVLAVRCPLAQTKYVVSKPPKFTLTFALSYNYALSRAFGDLTNCTVLYDPLTEGRVFAGQNYGMLQGGSVMSIGKLAVDKRRKIRLTLNLGYSLFYNTALDNVYKNQWHLFSGAFGMEYNFAPKARYRPYIGYELMYTLMFGGWQYGITEASGTLAVYYRKFKPAHRFGMAFNSGVEYMINQRIGVTFGGRIVWANVVPKQNRISYDPNYLYINDAKSDNGVDIGFRKQIVYFQFVGGVSLFLQRK